jgi:hypothetical protein
MTMHNSKVRNTTRTTLLHIRHTKNSWNMLSARTYRPDHETLGPHAICSRQVEAAMQQRERVAGESLCYCIKKLAPKLYAQI